MAVAAPSGHPNPAPTLQLLSVLPPHYITCCATDIWIILHICMHVCMRARMYVNKLGGCLWALEDPLSDWAGCLVLFILISLSVLTDWHCQATLTICACRPINCRGSIMCGLQPPHSHTHTLQIPLSPPSLDPLVLTKFPVTWASSPFLAALTCSASLAQPLFTEPLWPCLLWVSWPSFTTWPTYCPCTA